MHNTEIDDQIMRLVDDSVWPVPNYVASALSAEHQADDVYEAIGRLMNEGRIVAIDNDGMAFLTTPERWNRHKASDPDITEGS